MPPPYPFKLLFNNVCVCVCVCLCVLCVCLCVLCVCVCVCVFVCAVCVCSPAVDSCGICARRKGTNCPTQSASVPPLSPPTPHPPPPLRRRRLPFITPDYCIRRVHGHANAAVPASLISGATPITLAPS